MAPKGVSAAELEALYRERFPSFVRVATVISGERESGRDAVQSAFVSAVRSRKSFRGSGSLEAWVWRIVVNEARRARRTGDLVSIDQLTEQAAFSNGDGDTHGSAVRGFIAGLPQRQREAVFLRYFADLDYRTIASVLGLEPGTVSATLSVAHQTLRKRMEATQR